MGLINQISTPTTKLAFVIRLQQKGDQTVQSYLWFLRDIENPSNNSVLLKEITISTNHF